MKGEGKGRGAEDAPGASGTGYEERIVGGLELQWNFL